MLYSHASSRFYRHVSSTRKTPLSWVQMLLKALQRCAPGYNFCVRNGL